MKKNAIEVFGEWADLDKDFGMEKNHKESVINMINYSIKNLNHFTFIDAGCGNGWVIRKVSENNKCEKAIGVDGSKKMITKAKKILPGYEYHCADLMTWRPKEKVNIVHSMEVIYYVTLFSLPLTVIFTAIINLTIIITIIIIIAASNHIHGTISVTVRNSINQMIRIINASIKCQST